MKDIEEIRKDNGYSQIVFADLIGSTFRTYQGRLQGVQPKWTLNEIIKASEMNNGEVKVPTINGTYEITIKKVDE